MSDFITVNGRKYVAKELDFNFICDLGIEGVNVTEIGEKPLVTIRTYVAYCMGVDSKVAGEEINKHIVNGGSLQDFTEIFEKKGEESDFFRAISGQTEQKETPKRNTKKKEAEVSE